VVSVHDTGPLGKRVAHVGGTLLSALRQKNLLFEPVRFVVVRGSGPNASSRFDEKGYCTIPIDVSLIQKVGANDDALAFILAHELAHRLARYVTSPPTCPSISRFLGPLASGIPR
jgi:hypothetical protein